MGEVAELYNEEYEEETLSTAIKGVVKYINEKEWTDRRSGEDIILYSFKLEGDDDYYRTGQAKPGFEEGNSIRFEVDKNNNVDMDTIEVLSSEVKKAPKATGGKSRSSSRPVSGGGASSKDEYWAAKEKRDLDRDERYQSVDIPRMTFCTSQDAAVELVAAALQHDCLPKIGTVAKSERLSALLAFVDEITERFFKQRMAADTDGASKTEEAEEVETEEEERDLDD